MSNEQTIDTLPGENRGIPSVNSPKSSNGRRGAVVVVVLICLLIVGGLAYFKFSSKTVAAEKQKSLQVSNSVPPRTFSTPPPPLPAAAAPAAPAPIVPAPQGQAAPALPGTSNTQSHGMGGQSKPIPALDKSSSGLMAGSTKGSAPAQESANSAAAASQGGGASSGFTDMLQASSTPMRSAGMLGDKNFILPKGSFIDCALQTRLDSTVPGMTACVITRNIFSDNGKVLLIERGSTITGEYKSNMKQGMARIFVLWNRIKTPNGVVVNLDSPGTDPLGGSGLPGYIDTHFWQRFGGALMLSLIDDVAAGLTKNSGGSTQFNFDSTGDATQNMAAEALKNTINIPPTLYKNQGEQIGIYIARDLDFSSVYDLKPTQH